MSMPAASATHRARVLRALGMTPWVRRTRAATVGPEVVPEVDSVSGAGEVTDAAVACVVVLPEGCQTRELDLLGRALVAAGAVLARAARMTVSGGQLAGPVPVARAYLVFGEAQAHALGRQLPAAVMHRAQIALVDEPVQVLTSAAAKRRLWIALRTLRRMLASAEG